MAQVLAARHIAPTAPWRAFAALGADERMPAELVDMLDAGRPVVLEGRSSDEGRTGRRLSVDDTHDAAAQLANAVGLDFTGVLPAKAVLHRAFDKAEVVRSVTPDGKAFTNRFVVIDMREQAQLVVLISVGSGHLLNSELSQPVVVRAGRLIRQVDCALNYMKRQDRGARADWALKERMLSLEQCNAFLGDEDGIGHVDDPGRKFGAFFKGASSRKQAQDLPVASINGQRNQSGTEFVGGQVDYHIATSVPPGLATVWMDNPSGRPVRRIAFLDTPACRPSEASVAYGLPQVFKEGRPVDQVANVRFVLQHWGLPGWSQTRIVHELVDRKYSTEGLRAVHRDPGASIGKDQGAGRQQLKTILDHLEEYESGILRRKLGDGQVFEITNFFPPDGPWATPDDFARIRRQRKEQVSTQARAVKLAFSGVTATYDGVEVRLVSNRSQSRRFAGPGHAFALAEHYPDAVRVPKRHVALPAAALAASLARGLSEAGTLPLALEDPKNLFCTGDETISAMRAELTLAESEVDTLVQELRTLEGRVHATNPDGSPVLEGALLKKLNQDYNTVAEEQLPAAEERRANARAALDERLGPEPEQPEYPLIPALLASLSDPLDRTFNMFWKSNLINVVFTSTMSEAGGAVGRTLRWRGAIRFAVNDRSILVPFEGKYVQGELLQDPSTPTGRRSRDREEAEGLLNSLADGTPLAEARSTRLSVKLRKRLGELLGVGSRPLLLTGCDDPRITRLAVRVLVAAEEDLPELAAELEEPVELLTRIRHVHLNESCSHAWRSDGDTVEAAMYRVAARHDGWVKVDDVVNELGTTRHTVYTTAHALRRDAAPAWVSHRKSGYRLEPCTCGSRRRAPATIREVAGTVCLDCRRDSTGVSWPTSYDRHLAR